MCTTTSTSVLFCKKPRGTKRPWYRLFEKDTPVLLRAGALSIQQKFWFEFSKIPRAKWNGSFRFHRPVPSHRVFAYYSFCKCKERFSMNSLFASNIIYSFQIFALTLFLVIHTEFALRGFSPAKRLVPFYFPLFHLFVFTK